MTSHVTLTNEATRNRVRLTAGLYTRFCKQINCQLALVSIQYGKFAAFAGGDSAERTRHFAFARPPKPPVTLRRFPPATSAAAYP
jgi:hypothetical protein